MKTIIYSHGFGAEATDRGLFTDISNFLPNFNHVTFNYNHFDASKNQMMVADLQDQARKLESIIASQASPENEISIIAHSQGCVVAAMVNPDNIKKMVFLAPPASFSSTEDKVSKMLQREGAHIMDGGNLYYPRRDGSTTIIGRDYWDSRQAIVPMDLYNQVAQKTSLTIVRALNDEVLASTDYTGLSDGVVVVDMEADHDFTGQSRQALLEGLAKNIDKINGEL